MKTMIGPVVWLDTGLYYNPKLYNKLSNSLNKDYHLPCIVDSIDVGLNYNPY